MVNLHDIFCIGLTVGRRHLMLINQSNVLFLLKKKKKKKNNNNIIHKYFNQIYIIKHFMSFCIMYHSNFYSSIFIFILKKRRNKKLNLACKDFQFMICVL